MALPEHEICAYQPMIEQQFMVYRDGELEIEHIGESWFIDIDQGTDCECICGEQFDNREEAKEHIEEVRE